MFLFFVQDIGHAHGAYKPPPASMSQTLLSLAGFQVIISGRFWVIAEVARRGLRSYAFSYSHMDITQGQFLRVSGIELWGRFASSDMEKRFRSEYLVEDSKTANFLALIYIFSTVVFGCIDWALKAGAPTFLILIVPRSVILLSSTALVLRLRYAITPLLFDRWLVAWFSLNLLMELYVHSTRVASETAVAGILFVFALTLLVP